MNPPYPQRKFRVRRMQQFTKWDMVEKSGKSENLDLLLDFTFLSKINTVRYYFYFSTTTHKNYIKNAKIPLKHILEN